MEKMMNNSNLSLIVKNQSIYIIEQMEKDLKTVQSQARYYNQQNARLPLWLAQQSSKYGVIYNPELKFLTKPKHQQFITTQKEFRNKTMKNKSKITSKTTLINSLRPSLQNSLKNSLSYMHQKYIVQSQTQLNKNQQFLLSKIPISRSTVPFQLHNSLKIIRKTAYSQHDNNITELAQSVLIPVNETQIRKRRIISLKDKILQKNEQLKRQFQKTNQYHKKVLQWIGLSSDINMRSNSLIQKVRKHTQRSHTVSQ